MRVDPLVIIPPTPNSHQGASPSSLPICMNSPQVLSSLWLGGKSSTGMQNQKPGRSARQGWEWLHTRPAAEGNWPASPIVTFNHLSGVRWPETFGDRGVVGIIGSSSPCASPAMPRSTVECLQGSLRPLQKNLPPLRHHFRCCSCHHIHSDPETLLTFLRQSSSQGTRDTEA